MVKSDDFEILLLFRPVNYLITNIIPIVFAAMFVYILSNETFAKHPLLANPGVRVES